MMKPAGTCWPQSGLNTRDTQTASLRWRRKPRMRLAPWDNKTETPQGQEINAHKKKDGRESQNTCNELTYELSEMVANWPTSPALLLVDRLRRRKRKCLRTRLGHGLVTVHPWASQTYLHQTACTWAMSHPAAPTASTTPGFEEPGSWLRLFCCRSS